MTTLEEPPPDPPQGRPRLPFSGWWPLLAGALAGLVLRLIFSGKGALSAMSSNFVYLVPVVVSMVTIYVAERRARRSWGYYFVAGGLANVLFVVGTLLLLIEGMICAIIILPLFMFQGGVAGVVMGAMCRWTNWPRRAVHGMAVLPVLLAIALPVSEPVPRVGVVERSVLIDAAPERIWPHLLDAPDIAPAEVDAAWMYRIGVPLPRSGITHPTASGLVREVTMGKAIHFEQIATDWRENEHLRWTYRFTEDSFPPGALDDHVKIGGRYFDVIDTVYTLVPRGNGSTELRIGFRYRVSTDFDWYAEPVARALIGNFEEVILQFYRRRAMAGVRPATG
jgi:hypothetical protein